MKELALFQKAWFWFGLLMALLLGVVLQRPDDRLRLYFCDVGQGDAVLITYRSTQILIDGGPDKRVLDCLARGVPFWDRRIEVVVNTHPDADHLTGIVDVLERYEVGHLFLNAYARETALYQEFLRAVAVEEAEVRLPTAGERVKLGPVELAFLWSEEQPQVLGATTQIKATNETSLVVELNYKEFEALLTGDISREVEEKLTLSEIEVLKVAHHGSRFSTGEELLEKTRPELAVISVGKNSYGHPTEEVIERLGKRAIRLLRTDQDGTVVVVTDGNKWGVGGKKS